ncbi:carbohydrate ABC transporter permease [Compostimonas suwonensis]|uniref:Multiple sugar transport system permease protein/sorbitol/mannitol transport system permease protein n=1 Tax=Compostimonas suwonensis TaxID=1048394 RepID=A0A2M9BBA2_9MICO|nr:carbohydrate ABC transporter permease [Compostimonas suwonensis]PJJ55216.1 multiple sugar transport system permease protein/sorbitol/mannitol transport system permease protein [Compostimonas suwonensis]
MTARARISLAIVRTIAILILLAMTLLPIVWVISTAFKSNSDILVFPPQVIPLNPTLDNFVHFFTDASTLRFFGNSIIATAVSTVLTVLLAVPAAYALNVHRFPRDVGRHIGLGFLLLRFLPAFAVVVPLFVMLRQFGLIDTVFALILVYTAFHLPIAIWMITPSIAQLPTEIREAASVDGAGPLRALWFVTVPLVRPAVATAAAFCSILSWNEFFFALIFTNQNARTYPILISSFVTDSGPEWGSIAVAALMAIIPIVIICVFLQRNLVSGLTAGAVR